jgi:hypothetical protein
VKKKIFTNILTGTAFGSGGRVKGDKGSYPIVAKAAAE